MTYKFTSDIVIGLEIHVELDTKSKLFCSCARAGNDEPNSRTCPYCLGFPGSKPVLNKKAVEYGIKLALATKSKIAKQLVFSRKSYFYPDLASNFQITQYELPLCEKGFIQLSNGKKINLIRIHLEEDPASLVHIGSMQKSPYVLVDYNRSGDPLAEIVTEPELTSPEEARDFMKQLITILEYLEVFNIENCIIKADANISIKESNYTRAEVKNITGFKDIERALNYEIKRQKKAVEEGIKLKPETRAWDADSGTTFSLRTKETEEDYGYIIEPNVPVVDLNKEWIESIKKNMPELAQDKLEKYEKEHGKVQSISVIIKNPKLAKFFEEVISDKEINPKLASHWVELELQRVLNYTKKTLDSSNITPKHLKDILKLVQSKKITEQSKEVFDVMEFVKKESLEVVEDARELEKICKEVLSEAKEAVEKFKKGNEKSFHYIVGQVMKKTKGKGKPELINDILKKLLK